MFINRPGARAFPGVIGAALMVACLAGCGGSGTYPVHGKLQYEDGQPIRELAGYNVTFTSDALQKSSRGEIKEDGTFELSTNKINDGAYPGEYKVTVDQPHPQPDRPERRKPFLDLDYENPEKTDLKATVEAKSNDFTFKLRRIKKGAR